MRYRNRLIAVSAALISAIGLIFGISAGIMAGRMIHHSNGMITDVKDVIFMEPVCVMAAEQDESTGSVFQQTENQGAVPVLLAADDGAPVLESVTIADTWSGVNPGDTIRLTFGITSSESSITGAAAVFKNEEGRTISAGGENVTLTEGKYLDVTVPLYTSGGKYTIERITLANSQNKVSMYVNPYVYSGSHTVTRKENLTDDQAKLCIIVNNEKNDAKPPVISGVEIEKEEAVPGEELKFAVKAYDPYEILVDAFDREVLYAGSGLSSVKFVWERQREEEDGDSLLKCFTFSENILFSDMKNNDGIYTGTIKLPEDCLPGTYGIKNITVTDMCGNEAEYTEFSADIAVSEKPSSQSAVFLSSKNEAVPVTATQTPRTGDSAPVTALIFVLSAAGLVIIKTVFKFKVSHN